MLRRLASRASARVVARLKRNANPPTTRGFVSQTSTTGSVRATYLLSGLMATGGLAWASQAVKNSDKTDKPAKAEELKLEIFGINEPENESEPKPSQQVKPGDVLTIVADTVDQEVLKTDKDVLLELYAPWCETCALLKYVVAQAAWALKDVDSVKVGIMNGQANYKRGFLPYEEARAFPLIKIFPGGRKGESVEWPEDRHSGKYTAESLLRFIHKHSSKKFDLEKVLKESSKLSETTDQLLRKEAKAQYTQFVTSSGAEPFLMANAPCQDINEKLMMHLFYAKYSEMQKPGDFEAIQTELRKCMKEKSTESIEYWGKLEKFSKGMKKQYERLKNKDTDGKAGKAAGAGGKQDADESDAADESEDDEAEHSAKLETPKDAEKVTKIQAGKPAEHAQVEKTTGKATPPVHPADTPAVEQPKKKKGWW